MLHRVHHITAAAIAAATALSLAACGGGTPSAGEALDDAIQSLCAKAHECRDSFPTDQGFDFEDFYGNSASECVTTFSALVDTGAIEASIDAGRIEFDGDAAQTCIDFQNGLTCAQYWGDEPAAEPQACDDAFQGTVADGGACTIDDDCAGEDSYCDEETGVCTAF